ncbi:class I SAM-dependent methyltransferase [Pseudalkalibacillus caeni]|uniref:Class I SAM-dependent methyltransferase n=1 Tax=Exobacillus caeni TaxID=2574798 RepID=A0A5R9F0S0_9BACL|nr:class I SAM-dependent methyltransferase [Pseudalkalibacillus caeni]TLS37147.1 class I SAM-dependent methyltransferase [Pseudalkalibacillus caeni]
MKQNIYDNREFFEYYTNMRDTGVTANDFIEQPALKALLPVLKGKSILDLGCGAGAFAKYCIEHDAFHVTGIDISSNMINLAKEKNPDEKISYLCSPFEDLDLSGNQFDLVVSSLAIHYIKDYTSLVKKVNELLKDNGQFIYSTEHPIVTARKEMNNWAKDKEGNKLHWALDHYQEEGKREQHWVIDGVIKYHRTVSSLVNGLIDNGFALEKMVEPQSTAEGLEKMPKIVNEERRPSFLLLKARKINTN